MIQKIINNRISIIFIIPFFLGLSSVFSFQPFNLAIINFITLPLLFFILVYINKRSKNIYRKKPYLTNLFLAGYCFGFGFFLSGNYWIAYSLTYEDSFKYLIPFAIILIPAFLGLFFGFASLAIGPFLKKNFHSILIFSVGFSLSDFIRSKILTGFPWNIWSYSLSTFPEILQSINVIGFFAFNLIVITIFCSPVLLFFKKKKLNLTIFSVLIFLVFSNYLYGSFVVNKNEKFYNVIKNQDINYRNIKIISPNFDLKYNLSENDVFNLVKKLVKYSEPDTEKNTIFVWPEGVFTGYNFSDLIKYKNIIEDNFSNKHKIIFGVNTYDLENKKYFNSLVVINNNFEIIYQYDKRKLVPFGEFLPLKNILNKYGFKKITEGYGSFSRGKITNNFKTEELNILPLICYEIIFPSLIQKSDIKTNLIVNISEDAWFGESIGPHQHFAKAVFRAIESNVYLVRSANKGISAFINNKGQVVKSLKASEAGNIEMDIPVINSNSKNRNDLIFFLLLFTYTALFLIFKKKFNDKK